MSIEKLGSKLNNLSENGKDIILTNCDNGNTALLLFPILKFYFNLGTIPAHVSSLMKGKGKVIVFGAAPVNIRTIERNLSAIAVNSILNIHTLYMYMYFK